jgi:hypothetical protein
MEKVMTDFYIKPDPDPHGIEEHHGPAIPLHYYDNDDGFWTDYIKMKEDRWAANHMIVRRPWVKH